MPTTGLADSYRRPGGQTIMSAPAPTPWESEKIGQKRKEYLDYLVNAAAEVEGLADLLDKPEGKKC